MEIFGHASIAGPATESRSILSENRQRGWKEVDSSCPAHIAKRIIEFRSKALGIAIAPAPASGDDLADARMRAALTL